MDSSLEIYITESRELLDEIEFVLLEIERAPADIELQNRLFRAVHTIKGSAGMFGLDRIVAFTHVAENLLDDVRKNVVPVNADLISVMMRCKDHIASLVNNVVDGSAVDDAVSQTLIGELRRFAPGAAHGAADTAYAAAPAAASNSAASSNTSESSGTFHISIRLSRDTFRQGFDAASIFRQLEEIGHVDRARWVDDAVPLLSDLDPEDCYLGWEIAFTSDAQKQAIAEIFQFMEGTITHILPPRSRIEDYLKLIEALPEEDTSLGAILVEIGSVTRSELDAALAKQHQSGGLTGAILVEQKAVQPEVVSAALDKQQTTRQSKQKDLASVRVDADKLDTLIDLVGELVVSGARVTQVANSLRSEQLDEALLELTKRLEEMRESALSLRMVPIGGSFSRFHRVVRDTAKQLNKQIRLDIFGAETELDKSVIEHIGDPLTHLVRNSMDHGLESADERKAAGKPSEGVIKLNAYHESGTIVIEVADDGRGLNRDKIYAKAVDRGIIKPGQTLSDTEIYNLIFEPGFSTADKVSEISGRGVGMDVVRRNIESLRGSVELRSQLGAGTTTLIRLPLTLAIIDGFHIKVMGESLIIPLDTVVECVTLSDAQRDEVNGHDYITLRDEVLPVLRLAQHFGVAQRRTDGAERVRMNLVVVQFGSRKAGLLVDQLCGETQAVIKPLGRVFQGLAGFAGFTIMGTGNVALVLDVAGLIKDACAREQKVQQLSWRTGNTGAPIARA